MAFRANLAGVLQSVAFFTGRNGVRIMGYGLCQVVELDSLR